MTDAIIYQRFDADDNSWNALTFGMPFQGIHLEEDCTPMDWVQVDNNLYFYEKGNIEQMCHSFRSAYLYLAS